MTKNKTDWNILGFVIASEYRKSILLALKDKPRTPKELTKITGFHFSHVSSNLKNLQKVDLVECLNPRATKGRLFKLSKKGEILIKSI